MHYIAIKITQITVFYMTIFAPTCLILQDHLQGAQKFLIKLLLNLKCL